MSGERSGMAHQSGTRACLIRRAAVIRGRIANDAYPQRVTDAGWPRVGRWLLFGAAALVPLSWVAGILLICVATMFSALSEDGSSVGLFVVVVSVVLVLDAAAFAGACLCARDDFESRRLLTVSIALSATALVLAMSIFAEVGRALLP